MDADGARAGILGAVDARGRVYRNVGDNGVALVSPGKIPYEAPLNKQVINRKDGLYSS